MPEKFRLWRDSNPYFPKAALLTTKPRKPHGLMCESWFKLRPKKTNSSSYSNCYLVSAVRTLLLCFSLFCHKIVQSVTHVFNTNFHLIKVILDVPWKRNISTLLWGQERQLIATPFKIHRVWKTINFSKNDFMSLLKSNINSEHYCATFQMAGVEVSAPISISGWRCCNKQLCPEKGYKAKPKHYCLAGYTDGDKRSYYKAF